MPKPVYCSLRKAFCRPKEAEELHSFWLLQQRYKLRVYMATSESLQSFAKVFLATTDFAEFLGCATQQLSSGQGRTFYRAMQSQHWP